MKATVENDTDETVRDNWFHNHSHWVTKKNLVKSFVIFNSFFVVAAIVVGIALEIVIGKKYANV
jgi:hypothetical protein